MSGVFGDWTIRYSDGTSEDVAAATLTWEGGFLKVYAAATERLVPGERVKDIIEWDRYGFRRSYEALMALPDEAIARVYEQLEGSPIRIAAEVPSAPSPETETTEPREEVR